MAGRVTYAFASRYFTEFNFGYNGSERFAKKERFGFFPSAGIGWLISNENFWSGELNKTVNKLKLKATYGNSGNDAIGDENDRFFYLSQVNMNNSGLGSSFGTYGNMGGRALNGISISRYPNENITWETATKLNLGFELGLFDKLEIQADFFSDYRENILMDRSYIPTIMGLQAAVRANVGEAASKGTDISVNYNHSISKDAWISGMANFTYAVSEFRVYEEPDYSDAPWRSRVGYSLNQNWGYIAERLFVDEDEVRNSPEQFGDYMAGDIKYRDVNGDGRISELDMVPVGYPTSPEIVYGFGLSAGWKNIDFSFFFQGLARESFWISLSNNYSYDSGMQSYRLSSVGTTPFIAGGSALLDVYARDHWSEDNRNIYALWPRLSDSYVNNNMQPSTWWMRDGSFLRLKSVELGYALPAKTASKVYMSGLRIYVSGTNLLTFSKFKLWDPEMGGNGLGYPVQQVFNFGLQVSF
jgi:TonB-linked SusC/RagA family outer membrane protein